MLDNFHSVFNVPILGKFIKKFNDIAQQFQTILD